jgi:hypothetical protein
MRIKSIDDESFIEITFCCDNRDAPQCKDDVAINVELVTSSGFCGRCDQVWFRRSVVDVFLNDLDVFESTRQNSVTLSAWPEIEFNPFELTITSFDTGQTMFVEIHLYKNGYTPDGCLVPYTVSSHFTFDPSMMLQIISEFENLFQISPLGSY